MQGTDVPVVSVVIPARNAADTLGDALESLVAQSEASFEAIVVDDGSSDATRSVAESYAARDPRFQVLAGEARGVSAARNVGVSETRGEWLLFLDADDWIEPDALRLLLERGRAGDAPDAVVSGWARVPPDGESFPVRLWDRPHEAFDCFATTCAFAIHSCLVRSDAVKRLGGFDESLVTCEDWDLWQRLARTGAHFATVDACLALYRMRPGAASSQGRRMLVDGLEVIGRGHAPDSRVPNADSRSVAGRDQALLTRTRLFCACYAAGLELGAGGDARPLLGVLGGDQDPDLDAGGVAECILDAAVLPGCCPPSRLDDLWPVLEPELRNFLAELEKRCSPGFARQTQRAVERLVLERSEERLPLTIGSTHCTSLDLSQPIEDIQLRPEVQRLICRAELDGELLARIELPVCDGFVPAAVLADALAAEVFWPVLRRFLGGDDAGGWELFLQELWGLPDWPEARFYDPAPNGRARRKARASGGAVSIEVSEELPDVRVRGDVLAVEVSVGGATVGVVQVAAPRRKVAAQELRTAISADCGLELALVAVRETLLGGPLPAGTPLRDLLRERAATDHQSLVPEETLVVPRWHGPVRGPASRRAALPVEAARELALASAGVIAPSEPPSRARYEPAIQAREAKPPATPTPPTPLLAEPVAESTSLLPILMYHRIADHGPAALRRYRLSPAAFDEQLHWLREQGYRGVTLGEWRTACERRRPLPGRALMLTFDDGYSDFAEAALPALDRHGFPATVFVVTSAVGRTSEWDAARGEPAPLMSWDELRALREHSVELGSHTRTHPALSGLSNADVVRELARSRAELEDKLGEPPTAIAYPYGDLDGAIAHLAGACGYTLGFTCEPRHAELTERPLELPRLEVEGHFDVTDLTRSLTSH